MIKSIDSRENELSATVQLAEGFKNWIKFSNPDGDRCGHCQSLESVKILQESCSK